MNQDRIRGVILKDGTIKTVTDTVSAANHTNADNLLKEIFRAAGGPVEIKHRHGKTVHFHSASSMTSLEAGGHNHEH